VKTSDSPTSVWQEARRLLDERASWTTDSGAYLESEQVTVLVHPVLHDQKTSGASVDVVVTVRPHRAWELPAGARVRLVGATGSIVSMPLSARGHAVFRRLPAGEWSAGLFDDVHAESPSTQVRHAEAVPLRTIPRLLAAAAGDRPSGIREVYRSVDGRLTTEVVESPEARLLVRISGVDVGSTPLVRVRWSVVAPETTETVRTLVVPLASDDGGQAMVAKYDLGSLQTVQAVRIGPAERVEASELTGDLVRQAFAFSLYGSARRGWEDLARSGSCPPAVEAVLREILER